MTPVMGSGLAEKVNEALNLRIASLKNIGRDALIECYVIK